MSDYDPDNSEVVAIAKQIIRDRGVTLEDIEKAGRGEDRGRTLWLMLTTEEMQKHSVETLGTVISTAPGSVGGQDLYMDKAVPHSIIQTRGLAGISTLIFYASAAMLCMMHKILTKELGSGATEIAIRVGAAD